MGKWIAMYVYVNKKWPGISFLQESYRFCHSEDPKQLMARAGVEGGLRVEQRSSAAGAAPAFAPAEARGKKK